MSSAPCGDSFLCAGVVVELCRLRHSAAESLFFNFTFAKIDEKSSGFTLGLLMGVLCFPFGLLLALWVLLGVFLGLSGCSRVSFWIPWVVAGGSFVLLGWPLGASVGLLGVSWASFRCLCGAPGWLRGALGVSWVSHGCFWEAPGCFRGALRASWASVGRLLSATGCCSGLS